jgi:hypothetical protein
MSMLTVDMLSEVYTSVWSEMCPRVSKSDNYWASSVAVLRSIVHKLSPCIREADSLSAGQEIVRLLWISKVHYLVHVSTALVYIVGLL